MFQYKVSKLSENKIIAFWRCNYSRDLLKLCFLFTNFTNPFSDFPASNELRRVIPLHTFSSLTKLYFYEEIDCWQVQYGYLRLKGRKQLGSQLLDWVAIMKIHHKIQKHGIKTQTWTLWEVYLSKYSPMSYNAPSFPSYISNTFTKSTIIPLWF